MKFTYVCFSEIYYSSAVGNCLAPVWINLAAPQQIKQACLRSACTSFDTEITSNGVHGNKRLIQSYCKCHEKKRLITQR